ncbi:hypothetical protein O181_109992 [Austropuccinia psidii MF-1]|uniref:Uncharacterized protein n=1 Tax=Austropuccinia psidii MF-1 TaxID=1389203 RepID=A0A9Q3PRX5_9BASI|nr:hypothetical protein [Austropuccinia psidii MF-1]
MFSCMVEGSSVNKSEKLGGVSTSSTEAEYRSYLSTFHEEKLLSLLEGEVHKEKHKSTTIHNDKQAAINKAKKYIYHPRTEHIFVDYNSIRDLNNNREINFNYLETEEIVSDCLKEELYIVKQQTCNKYMGLI